MIRADVLLIMRELGDFTNKELQQALEMSSGSIADMLDIYRRKGLIESVKVGLWTLNTLTEKGKRATAKLPAIDAEERLLPLMFAPVIIPDETERSLECHMCGKYSQHLDEDGHCSTCRQVWNG